MHDLSVKIILCAAHIETRRDGAENKIRTCPSNVGRLYVYPTAKMTWSTSTTDSAPPRVRIADHFPDALSRTTELTLVEVRTSRLRALAYSSSQSANYRVESSANSARESGMEYTDLPGG